MSVWEDISLCFVGLPRSATPGDGAQTVVGSLLSPAVEPPYIQNLLLV